MRSIIIGLGIQGLKRKSILGSDLVATIDTNNEDANASNLQQLDSSSYDVIFSCVPDEFKLQTIYEAIELQKSCLVEKPLLMKRSSDFDDLENLSNKVSVYLQTAYNHRFEPNIIRTWELINSDFLGEIYSFRCFYGNGTAGLISKSNWRDSSYGAGVDLGSHVLDLMVFLFGQRKFDLVSQTWNHETSCPDRAILFGKYGTISITVETTYLSWKNTFLMEVIGENGSIIVEGLCKWSESTLEKRLRKFPSGLPVIQKVVEPQGDPTWKLEIRDFMDSIKGGRQTDLTRDKIIQEMLEESGLIKRLKT